MPAVVSRPGPPDSPEASADATAAVSSVPVVGPVTEEAVAEAQAASGEALHAFRNALKLGGSLLVTLGMSFGVKLLLPRYLGPDRFGPINFTDGFTTGLFVIVNLGVDIYIRRELPVRPEHANDFIGGMLLTRMLAGVVAFAAMTAALLAGHKTHEVMVLALTFGVAQMLVAMNQSLSALLHSQGKVDGLSVSNVLTKALWGVLIVAGLVLGVDLLSVPLALALSEAVELVILIALTRKHLTLRWAVNWGATWAVILASLPFYLNQVAHTAYNKLAVIMLSFMGDDHDVGLYGAASNLAGITLLLTPLIGWVLMPLYSKAASRSEEAFNQILRRSLELILTLSFPVSLMLGVGADVWMSLVGKSFEEATLALRILAPLFLVTYVAMLGATCLVNLRRAWTMTFISLFGLALNPVLNWALIRHGTAVHPALTGSSACAVADTVTEVLVTTVIMILVGRRAFDARSLTRVAKTVAVCAAVAFADHAMRPLGPLRVLLDAVLYTVGVVGTGAVNLPEMLDFLRSALRRRRENPA